MLWYILRPGEDVYSCRTHEKYGKKEGAYVVNEVTRVAPRDGEVEKWNIGCFILSGDQDKIGRLFCRYEIESFEGEQEITSLPAIPAKYLDKLDGGKRRQAFESRGKRMYDLIRAGHTQAGYQGMSIYKGKRKKVGLGSCGEPNH
jgi:hypothetical protein